MWVKARQCILLISSALFMHSTMAQDAARTMDGSGDVVLTMPITIDGSLRNLQLLRGESYENAAVSFAKNHGLMETEDEARVRGVIDQLSTLLKDRMEEVGNGQPVVQFTIPLTIDGQTTELTKYENEKAEVAIERYLQASSYAVDVQRELYPQLMDLVNRKLEELSPPKKELFAFTLSIDNQQANVHHFEGGDPMEEARETLRAIGVNPQQGDANMDGIVSQIANEIVKRIQSMNPPPQSEPVPPTTEKAETATHEAGARPALRELFSIPLTLNGQNSVLVHYEGRTARESALQFLSSSGVSDTNTMNELLPQLVELIDNRMAEMLNEEAQQQRERSTQEAAQPAQPNAEKPSRAPLLVLPINVGENQASLEYFEGDSVERTVELFLQRIGITEESSFQANARQLIALLQERIQAVMQERSQARAAAAAGAGVNAESSAAPQEEPQATSPRLLMRVPVTLSGNVFDMEYYEGQEPRHVANAFCVEKYELIRSELGVQFDGNQLQECQNVLVNTISKALQEHTASADSSANQPSGEATSEQKSADQPVERELMFTLDIDVDDENAQLPFYRNEDPDVVARVFCDKYGVDKANIPALVEAIQEQLRSIN